MLLRLIKIVQNAEIKATNFCHLLFICGFTVFSVYVHISPRVERQLRARKHCLHETLSADSQTGCNQVTNLLFPF